jgi:[protein-PII] uridylyltransferase
MSSTAFKLDIGDPRTIQDFVERVQSPERLKLLLVLTAVDIRAVGPKVWNNWKAGLLRELYANTDTMLTGGLSVAEAATQRVEGVKIELRRHLADWSEAEFTEHLKIGNPGYWLSEDAETLARQARLIRRAKAEQAPLAIDTKVEPMRGVTEVTILTGDHPGLFARIAGALAVSGANIVDARIHTLTNGMALDSFSVQDTEGGLFDRPNALARLAVLVEQALAGRLRQLAELKTKSVGPARTRVFTVKPRVLIDNEASSTHTVLELNGRDRPGLLYEVGRVLHQVHLQISTARIATYGEQVVDVFYVKDLFGLKIFHEAKLAEIRDKLLAALADPNEIERPAASRRQPNRRGSKASAAE